MIRLSRTVRLCLSTPYPTTGAPASTDHDLPPRNNGFSAWPPMRGLGRYYEIHVTCDGEADPKTGYFINISEIDRIVHNHALPILYKTLTDADSDAAVPLGRLMQNLITATQPPLNDTVSELTLQLTPFYDIAIRRIDMDHVYIRQQYEFAASHRLNVPSMTPERNRELFGKCNHESGHGHNYRVVVTVKAPIGTDGAVERVEHLDAIVDKYAIQHLDHKHLNRDVTAFANTNPSVENIARAIYQMIEAPIAALGVRLTDVSVWETTKTVCTYSGDDPPHTPNPTPQTSATSH